MRATNKVMSAANALPLVIICIPDMLKTPLRQGGSKRATTEQSVKRKHFSRNMFESKMTQVKLKTEKNSSQKVKVITRNLPKEE